MGEQVQIDSEEQGDVIVLTLKGRLDAVTSAAAEEQVGQMVDENHKKLLLNFEGVDYLSSAGMRMLLSTTKKLRSFDGKLVLCQVRENVMDVFKMSGFDHLLEITSDVDEGLERLQ